MKEYMKKYWIYIVVGIVLVTVLFIPSESNDDIDVIASPSVEEQEQDVEYIYVDLKGHVKNPGVYKLESDARLYQVISMAGGLLDIADTLAINMSMSLEDEMAIYVPSVYDNIPPVTIDDEIENELIDINQAGVILLQTLPGIGPTTAQNIVDYRDQEGYFKSIEDIMNVPNIGESTFEQIKDLITIEE